MNLAHLASLIADFKIFILDLIFPRHCVGCRKELDSKSGFRSPTSRSPEVGLQVSKPPKSDFGETWKSDFIACGFICKTCFNKINLAHGLRCHVCGLRNPDGTCLSSGDVPEGHKNCRSKTALKGLYAAGHYQDPILRELIHAFKYHSIESLKNPLSRLLKIYIKNELFTNQPIADKLKNSILVPIPLTRRRKISRGFNQSELLAEELAIYLNCPAVNLLKRKKSSTPQAGISDWQKRKENVTNAFEINNLFLSPTYQQFYRSRTSIILVDDVSTSGATLEEAAGVLKSAGFKEIYGLVIAKG